MSRLYFTGSFNVRRSRHVSNHFPLLYLWKNLFNFYFARLFIYTSFGSYPLCEQAEDRQTIAFPWVVVWNLNNFAGVTRPGSVLCKLSSIVTCGGKTKPHHPVNSSRTFFKSSRSSEVDCSFNFINKLVIVFSVTFRARRANGLLFPSIFDAFPIRSTCRKNKMYLEKKNKENNSPCFFAWKIKPSIIYNFRRIKPFVFIGAIS